MTENDSKEKARKLNALIDALPVCGDSKKGIKALVEEMTGVKIVPPAPKSMSIIVGCKEENIWVALHGGQTRCLFPIKKNNSDTPLEHTGYYDATDRKHDIKNITLVDRETGEEKTYYNANME